MSVTSCYMLFFSMAETSFNPEDINQLQSHTEKAILIVLRELKVFQLLIFLIVLYNNKNNFVLFLKEIGLSFKHLGTN